MKTKREEINEKLLSLADEIKDNKSAHAACSAGGLGINIVSRMGR